MFHIVPQLDLRGFHEFPDAPTSLGRSSQRIFGGPNALRGSDGEDFGVLAAKFLGKGVVVPGRVSRVTHSRFQVHAASLCVVTAMNLQEGLGTRRR